MCHQIIRNCTCGHKEVRWLPHHSQRLPTSDVLFCLIQTGNFHPCLRQNDPWNKCGVVRKIPSVWNGLCYTCRNNPQSTSQQQHQTAAQVDTKVCPTTNTNPALSVQRHPDGRLRDGSSSSTSGFVNSNQHSGYGRAQGEVKVDAGGRGSGGPKLP